MNNMKYVKLGDYCEITSSKRIFAEQYVSEGIPFYRSREIIEKKEGRDISEPLFITLDLFNSIKEKYGVPQERDLLLTSVGTLGVPYLVKEETFYFKDGNLTWMKNFDKNLNPEYLYYWLNTKFGKESLILKAIGSSQPALTIDILKKYKFFIPTIDEQNRIVSMISLYDQLIDNNLKRVKILDQMIEELYKEWFVRFRYPGNETDEFENGIPKSWKINKLGDLATISTGKCNREDAEDDGIYPLFDRSQEIKKSNTWIKDCEAIIVPGEGTSFMPRYYKGKFNLHQRCYCVEPSNSNCGAFLFYTLKLNRKYFLSVATGATVPSLRLGNFLSMKFIYPTEELCEKFNNFALDVFKTIDNLKFKNQNLIKQRDLLLPRLMSGKLETK